MASNSEMFWIALPLSWLGREIRVITAFILHPWHIVTRWYSHTKHTLIHLRVSEIAGGCGTWCPQGVGESRRLLLLSSIVWWVIKESMAYKPFFSRHAQQKEKRQLIKSAAREIILRAKEKKIFVAWVARYWSGAQRLWNPLLWSDSQCHWTSPEHPNVLWKLALFCLGTWPRWCPELPLI